MKKTALISVSDKTALEALATSLQDKGWDIVSTGGTATYLEERDINVIKIEDFTGFPEILGGRVKTLHPKIHGAILRRPDVQVDTRDCDDLQIGRIDMVVCNLYSSGEMDIGGPSMIRSAIKNIFSVLPVVDHNDYTEVISCVIKGKDFKEELRNRYAKKALLACLQHDLANLANM